MKMLALMKPGKARIAAAFAATAMSIGAAAGPAAAQPVVTGGLVNITITDVLNNVTVQVPIGVAANVCGVSANVLAQNPSQTVNCTSATTQQLPVAFRP
jgi:hypothetical protein